MGLCHWHKDVATGATMWQQRKVKGCHQVYRCKPLRFYIFNKNYLLQGKLRLDWSHNGEIHKMTVYSTKKRGESADQEHTQKYIYFVCLFIF